MILFHNSKVNIKNAFNGDYYSRYYFYDYYKSWSLFLTEIPGPPDRNTSPATNSEDFKYSTPIEGPDNQFGSAESSDDEDDKEIDNDFVTKIHKILPNNNNNIHKNKTLPLNTTNLVKLNLSNKVRKIINKFESEAVDVISNRGTKYSYHAVNILTSICLTSYFLN